VVLLPPTRTAWGRSHVKGQVVRSENSGLAPRRPPGKQEFSQQSRRYFAGFDLVSRCHRAAKLALTGGFLGIKRGRSLAVYGVPFVAMHQAAQWWSDQTRHVEIAGTLQGPERCGWLAAAAFPRLAWFECTGTPGTGVGGAVLGRRIAGIGTSASGPEAATDRVRGQAAQRFEGRRRGWRSCSAAIHRVSSV